MFKYIACAATAALLATSASAVTMSQGYFGDGFSYTTTGPDLDGNSFGPSETFSTVSFDRGGSDFYFLSFVVKNTSEITGSYSYTGYQDLVEEYSDGGPVAGLSEETINSIEPNTAIDLLKITYGTNARELLSPLIELIGCEATIQTIDTDCRPETTEILGVSIQDVELSAVPLPASMLLLGAGIAGLGAMRRRKKS